jgi:hypothetical protein
VDQELPPISAAACRRLGSPAREEGIERNENERGIPAIDETLEIAAYAFRKWPRRRIAGNRGFACCFLYRRRALAERNVLIAPRLSRRFGAAGNDELGTLAGHHGSILTSTMLSSPGAVQPETDRVTNAGPTVIGGSGRAKAGGPRGE